jgi:hypothetical protein
MYLPRFLMAIWVFGLAGVAADLVLLEHYEDVKQLIPFAVIAVALAVAGWYWLRPGAASLRAFRTLLLVVGASGLLGLFLHYRGNVEFEKERDAALGGIPLVWASLTGATPALAPGTMVLFAFLGYAVILSRPGDGPSR